MHKGDKIMAKLIIGEKIFDIEDGSSISEICRKQGIPFNCNTGVCGSCRIKILEGAENLSDLQEEELEIGLDLNNRLSCMCTIKNGTVKISS